MHMLHTVRMSEGAESILFREKFVDWPEPGRIIKMKGHVSSGPITPMICAVLQPADVDKMLKPSPPFEGLRLDGENVYRGQGNFKVSRYRHSFVTNLKMSFFASFMKFGACNKNPSVQ